MKYNQVKKIAPNFKSIVGILIFSLFLSFTATQAQNTFQQYTPPVFQQVPLNVEITKPSTMSSPHGLGGSTEITPLLISNNSAPLEARTNRVLKNASYQWQVSTNGLFHKIIANGSGFIQNHTQIVNWTPVDNNYVSGNYYLTVVITEANGKRTASEPLLITVATLY